MALKTLRQGITRRQALGLAGGAGAAYAVGGIIKVGEGGDSTLGVESAQAASCTLAPEVTEGPYWVDEDLNRADVTAGQAGVPLTVTFNVLNSATCTGYEGAQVDIWHCNAQGVYSDIASEGSTGQTYLRGYQVTDSNGQCTLKTIFPGWYQGRTVHIHVRVRTFDGSSTTYNFTTQVFFTESDTAAVVATSDYQKSGSRTTNSQDSIYGEEVTKGNALVPTLSGNTSSGYTGSVQISLAGLPATSGTSTTDTEVDGGVRTTKVVREKNGMRFFHIRVRTGEKLTANVHLMRGSKVVAHKRIDALAAGGTRTVAVPIPNKVRGGKAGLKVKLTDQAGNTKTVRRKVHIPG